jgi:hypothetical protein
MWFRATTVVWKETLARQRFMKLSLTVMKTTSHWICRGPNSADEGEVF